MATHLYKNGYIRELPKIGKPESINYKIDEVYIERLRDYKNHLASLEQSKIPVADTKDWVEGELLSERDWEIRYKDHDKWKKLAHRVKEGEMKINRAIYNTPTSPIDVELKEYHIGHDRQGNFHIREYGSLLCSNCFHPYNANFKTTPEEFQKLKRFLKENSPIDVEQEAKEYLSKLHNHPSNYSFWREEDIAEINLFLAGWEARQRDVVDEKIKQYGKQIKAITAARKEGYSDDEKWITKEDALNIIEQADNDYNEIQAVEFAEWIQERNIWLDDDVMLWNKPDFDTNDNFEYPDDQFRWTSKELYQLFLTSKNK